MHAEQLARLDLRVNNNGFSISVPTHLPNLKELHLAIESLDMTEIFVSRLLQSKCPPRLLKLGLRLGSPKYVPLKQAGTIDRVFQLFNLFGETLLALRITAYDNFGEDTSPEFLTVQQELTCPALKCVEIKGFSALSLNFLQNFKDTLEDISMNLSARDAPRYSAYPDEIVDVYNYVDNGKLYRSNVWEVLPNLQFLQLKYEYLEKKMEGRFTRKMQQMLHLSG